MGATRSLSVPLILSAVLTGCAGGSSALLGTAPAASPLLPLSCAVGPQPPSPIVRVGPADIAANDPARRCAAKATVDAGGVVVADSVGFGAALNYIGVTGAALALGGAQSATRDAARVAVSRDAQSRLRVLAWDASDKAESADAALASWQASFSFPDPFPDPPPLVWNHVLEIQTLTGDGNGNVANVIEALYHLNSNDASADHYLALVWTQTAPSYADDLGPQYGVQNAWSSGWYVTSVAPIFAALGGSAQFDDWQPRGWSASSPVVPLNIGSDLTGVSPNGAPLYLGANAGTGITGTSSGSLSNALWIESFTPGQSNTNPQPSQAGGYWFYTPATAFARQQYQSLLAATIAVPSPAAAQLSLHDTADLEYDENIDQNYFSSGSTWTTLTSSIASQSTFPFPAMPFALDRTKVTISMRQPSPPVNVVTDPTVSWQASTSCSCLIWPLFGRTNRGSTPVNLQVVPGTPAGTVADVTFDTSPPFQTRSVARGPIHLEVDITP